MAASMCTNAYATPSANAIGLRVIGLRAGSAATALGLETARVRRNVHGVLLQRREEGVGNPPPARLPDVSPGLQAPGGQSRQVLSAAGRQSSRRWTPSTER